MRTEIYPTDGDGDGSGDSVRETRNETGNGERSWFDGSCRFHRSSISQNTRTSDITGWRFDRGCISDRDYDAQGLGWNELAFLRVAPQNSLSLNVT